jgi:hypothetical protein
MLINDQEKGTNKNVVLKLLPSFKIALPKFKKRSTNSPHTKQAIENLGLHPNDLTHK